MRKQVFKKLIGPPVVYVTPGNWVTQWFIYEPKQVEAWFHRLLKAVRAVKRRRQR